MSLEFTPPVDTFSVADPGGILRSSWSEELRFGGALLWAEEMRALVAHPARLQRFRFSKYRTSFLLPHPNLCFSFGGSSSFIEIDSTHQPVPPFKTHNFDVCVQSPAAIATADWGTFPSLPKETRP